MKTRYGYKLTDSNMRTYNGTQWELGVTRTTSGKGELCTSGWLHSYRDPLLAVLLDPIHGNYGANARLFLIEVGGEEKCDRGLKFGNTEQTLIEEIEKPAVTLEQRVKFAQNCAEFARRAASSPRLGAGEIHEELRKCAYDAIGAKVPE